MYGRETKETCDFSNDRMPDPENGCNGLRDLFYDNIFEFHKERIRNTERNGYENLELAWVLTAAISGAHTLGKASPENSGYSGWWSD